jgi:glutaconate CoA-transferase subunit A
MANAYEAGAANLPFAVFRGYQGRRPAEGEPGDPLGDLSLHRRSAGDGSGDPARRAVIHALRADRDGNVLLEGIVGVQKEAVLAAKRAVVTVEEIVDDSGRAAPTPSSCRRGRWAQSRSCRAARYPSYAQGYYKRANAFYKAWDDIARERDTFLAWMKRERARPDAERLPQYAKQTA